MGRKLDRWAAKRGVAVEIVGVDMNPWSARSASEATDPKRPLGDRDAGLSARSQRPMSQKPSEVHREQQKTRSNRLSCRRRSVNSLHWTGSPTRTGRMWLVVCITGRSSDTIHQQAAHKNAGSFASQRPCHVDFAAAEGFRETIISSVWRIPNDHSPFRYSTRSFLSLSERFSLRYPL
jgi:hypothetical protein